MRQAYIVLERLDGDLNLPQLPILPVVPPPDAPLEVDWVQLEYRLAALDEPAQCLELQPQQQQAFPTSASAAGIFASASVASPATSASASYRLGTNSSGTYKFGKYGK